MERKKTSILRKIINLFKPKEVWTSPLVVNNQADSPTSEAYKVLRTNLHLVDDGDFPKSFAITSALDKEGKSSVAVNLAVAIAQVGKKVVLVDSDLRKPTLHKVFGLINDTGLSNYLIEENTFEEVLRETIIPNLKVVISGSRLHNPTEILSSQKMYSLIKHLEKEADVIIFDAAPLIPVADAMIVSCQVRGLILVVDYHSNRKNLMRVKQILDDSKARLFGAVIDKFPGGIDGYYYFSSCSRMPEKE
ncbi:MAG: CpsD/CapB family tyrosine-protein kinase [Elusimicrobia bacterium]|nr:CpsD/CapB family tyrosine-protein kinase [Elusimicrobiota bacterium]